MLILAVRKQILKTQYANYGIPGQSFFAFNNNFAESPLALNVDYTDTINVDTSRFPNNTIQEWNFPPTLGTRSIRAYPELVYGQTMFSGNVPSGNVLPTPKKITAFTALTVTYDYTIGGTTSDFDVMMEVFPTSTSGGYIADSRAEVMFFAHLPWTFDFVTYQFTAHGFDYYLGANGNTPPTPMIFVVPTGNAHGAAPPDALSGTFDFIQALQDIIAHGADLVGTAVGWYSGSGPVLTGEEYINGVELGPEISGYAGRLVTNSLSIDWR